MFHKVWDVTVEIFFAIDLILNFVQSYKDPDNFQIIKNHKQIAKKYIFRGWFIIDLIAVFPFYYIW
jgi:hypothetical protein